MPSRKQPTVVIETATGEQLLRELLACNSWSVRAVEQHAAAMEEQARALVQLARGFGLLSAVLSQQEYRLQDGVEEQGGKEEGTEKEKQKQKQTEALTMEEGNGAGNTEEMEAEKRTEEKGKEKETVTEAEVIVVEDGSEDGVREETLDAE
jgi:hypothetical protein